MMGVQPKIGVFFYRGPDKSDDNPLDWERLAEAVGAHPSNPVVHEIKSRDPEAGLGELGAVLREKESERVIVAAACPVSRVEPPLHQVLRAGGFDPSMSRVVNLSPASAGADKESATRRARVLIEMALVEAQYLEPETTHSVESHDAVLVVGGGIAGLTAAHELAAAGFRVVLVEQRPALGGKAALLHQYYPRRCNPACGIGFLVENLLQNNRVTIEKPALVAQLTGSPGRFRALVRRLDGDRCEVTYRVGAIINATGWESYDARRIKGFGYGVYPNVVTSLDLEQMAVRAHSRADKPTRPSDGRPVKRVAFIQCAGSRSERHLNYCSQICCTVTLKQAAYIREAYPDAEITVFYIDLRVLGKYEELYRRALEDGVQFVRGMPVRIEENHRTRDLVLRAADTLSGRRLVRTVDLVVLAVGMVPNRETDWLEMPGGSDLLHNPHDICFPSLTARPGIYTAGACEEPMDVAQSVRSSLGAAMRCVKFLGQKVEITGPFPVVDNTKCDLCGRCVSECPTGAMRFTTGDKPPVADPFSCLRCGICQGGCPLQCVALPSYGVQGVAKAIQAVNFGLLTEDPAILLFLCRHDAHPAYENALAAGLLPPNVVPIRVPCAGIVNMAWVADALMHGFDGIAVAGCPRRECHAGPGFSLAQERLAGARETLGQMMLEPERVKALPIGIGDAARLAADLQAFAARLKNMGPSPFRI